MAFATDFELMFGRGHAGAIDLAALPADRRGGRVAYSQARAVR